MWRSKSKSAVRIHNTTSPSSPFSCSSFKDIQSLCADENSQPTVKKISVFHRVRVVNSLLRAWSTRPPTQLDLRRPETEPEAQPPSRPEQHSDAFSDPPAKSPRIESEPSAPIPDAEQRIVVYFTSLRVVRSTFEDCRTVRSILRGFRVSIDERDLSMDSSFLTELQHILGPKELRLPRVFIGGSYIGGAEEILQLHEAGELKKLVERLPAAEQGVCDVCGGYRFVLCEECNGSHKLYNEKCGFKTCTECNENGLIRCPSCSSAPL